jgi:hypothetical protein
MIDHPQAWAVVLAGGHGNRLITLTTRKSWLRIPSRWYFLEGESTLRLKSGQVCRLRALC